MQLAKPRLMSSFRGRMLLASEAAAAAEAAQKNSLLTDPWHAPTGRLRGRVDWDGYEYITSQACLDALEVPMHARNGVLFRRLIKLMREHGWEPIRIKLNGVDGGDVTERVRGYQRKTNRLPYGHISKEFPGKIDTSTPYVIGKVVSRLEMDSRWALARAVRALVAERDALKETHETRQCATEQTSTRWAKTGAHNPFENITPPATSGLITHRGRVPADDSASDRDD